MLIILEGPDGSGKTTLAERLVTLVAVKFPDHTVKLLHRGPPTAHPLDEYAVPLLRYRPGRGHHLIIDRWHWGEMIYPRFLKRKTKMSHEIFTYIEMLIHQRGGLMVNVRHPVDAIIDRLRERGDDLIRTEWLPDIAQEYDDLAQAATTNLHRCETLTPDGIIDAARRLEATAYPAGKLTTAVSASWFPEVILMGDVRNCDGRFCAHWSKHSTAGTAFMPYSATSGQYLLKSLRPIGRERFALANAADDDLPSLVWDKFNRAPIVALGQNAHRALTVNGVPHATVPHPQYIRRFHYLAHAEYGRLIWSLAGTERNELKWRPSSPTLVGASTQTS
jgi:thymidylate kinase